METAAVSKCSLLNLSRQELRLVDLITQGYSTPEIAEVMSITKNTLKSYRKTVYWKLQIHSKRELFALVERTR
jgi:DNA-binding CsgD family transcriptional regulator